MLMESLQCGDLTEKYDAVVVLEDDLVVAEGFMQYVVAAVEAYKNNDEIAGISLYTHKPILVMADFLWRSLMITTFS